MATSRRCDCCQQPMAEYDAGQVPVVLRAKGIELVVQVVAKDGVPPNVRPDCLKTLMADAELVYPAKRPVTKAPPVTDPAASENEEDEKRHPVPERVSEQRRIAS